MRVTRLSFFLFCFFVVLSQAKADNLPDLANIKVAAEEGNAQAQDKLGDSYFSSFDYSEAVKWYRLAAGN